MGRSAFVPERVITDDLWSYGAAAHDLGVATAMSAGNEEPLENTAVIGRMALGG